MRAITFECLDIETSIFGMVRHIENILAKCEYQGHWVKVKVTSVNGLFGVFHSDHLMV